MTSQASVKFSKDFDEMIHDCPSHHVQVFDVDCQGMFNFNSALAKKFIQEYPGIYKDYVATCCLDWPLAGTIKTYPFQKDGVWITIVLMFTTSYIAGFQKDSKEDIYDSTIKCISKLIEGFPDRVFSSGVLNRYVGDWPKINVYLELNKINWTVHPN